MLRYLLVVSLLPVVLLATTPNDNLATLTKSGNDFLRMCEPRGEHSSTVEGFCSGYANGVIDGYDYAFATVQAKHHEHVTGAFCPPDEITRGQQYRVAVKYMNDHPEETHRIASVLIAESMQAAFPCPTKLPDVTPSK
jgi:Rap1a immunity proteins